MYAERTLIISGSEKGLQDFASFLKSCGCGTISTMTSGSEARRAISHEEYGLIIINAPLQDESGYQLSLKLSETTCAGILLICKADAAEEMANRTASYGVCVVSRPINKSAFLQAIRTGSAFHNRLTVLQKENKKLRAKLEEQRYVSRAKLLLITNAKMEEEEAHRYIEKMAMDTRRTKKEVSLELIAKYEY